MEQISPLHKLLAGSARNWLAVGLCVMILPMTALYRTWWSGYAMIIGIILGTLIAKIGTPDPRLLGTPWLRKSESVLKDGIHQSLMTHLKSKKKVVWPVTILLLWNHIGFNLFSIPILQCSQLLLFLNQRSASFDGYCNGVHIRGCMGTLFVLISITELGTTDFSYLG